MIPPSMQNAGKHDVMPVIELGDDFVKDINSFEAERSSNSRVKGGQSEPIHVSSTSSQSNPQNGELVFSQPIKLPFLESWLSNIK